MLTQGVPKVDFAFANGGRCAVGQAYQVVNTCTVMYTFTPGAPGQRLGGITLQDGASPANTLATTSLFGVGTAPQSLYTNPAPG